MTKTETIVLSRTQSNMPWEGCINSVNYRIERGIPVEVPDFVASLIRQSEQDLRMGEIYTRPYLSLTGLNLA